MLVAHLRDFAKWNRYFPDVYIKPWSRCPPYLYGLVLGAFYVEYLNAVKKEEDHFLIRFGEKLKSSRKIKWTLEIVGVVVMLFVLLIPRTLQVGYVWPQFLVSAFLTFSKIAFVIGLSVTITPSLLGVPSMVIFLMDTKFFNVIGKISFWTYLIHYMVLTRTDYVSKVDFYYSSITCIPYYAAHAFGALFFGFVGTMLVEVPFSKLEKKLFEKILGKEKRKTQIKDTIQSASDLNQSLNSSIKDDGFKKSLLSSN